MFGGRLVSCTVIVLCLWKQEVVEVPSLSVFSQPRGAAQLALCLLPPAGKASWALASC